LADPEVTYLKNNKSQRLLTAAKLVHRVLTEDTDYAYPRSLKKQQMTGLLNVTGSNNITMF
jgi:hypothetical protein